MKLLIFIYGWVVYNNSLVVVILSSDALLTNLPMIITAISSSVAVILGAIGIFMTALAKNRAAEAKLEAMEAVKISKENKADLGEVKIKVDGMVTKLLDAKDETAKAIAHSQKMVDAKDAAFNMGKLSQLEKQPAKEDVPTEIVQVVKEQTVEKQVLKKEEPPKK